MNLVEMNYALKYALTELNLLEVNLSDVDVPGLTKIIRKRSGLDLRTAYIVAKLIKELSDAK